jgi:hypothetical protein
MVRNPRQEEAMQSNTHSSLNGRRSFGSTRSARPLGLVPGGELYLESSRLAVDPLASHGGSGDNLFLRWNALPSELTAIDIVVHLHGYDSGSPSRALLERKVKIAGVELSSRSRPTLVVVPRGRKISERELQSAADAGKSANPARYTFDGLVSGGGLRTLLNEALALFSREVLGRSALPSVARIILTAHSGGGAALNRVLRQFDQEGGLNPHEVHVFDGIYGVPGQQGDGIVRWASARITADCIASQPGGVRGDIREAGGSLRIMFGPGTASGTQWIFERLGGSELLGGAARALAPYYRMDDAGSDHNGIPAKNGPRLLSDATSAVALSAGAYGTPVGLFRHYPAQSLGARPGSAPVPPARIRGEEEDEDIEALGDETPDDATGAFALGVSRTRALAASWASDDVSVDYRHLLPDAGQSGSFQFSAAHLSALARSNRFELPEESSLVVFGLRGARITGANDGAFHNQVELEEDMPDHQASHCLLGVWNRALNQIAVFTGSTVPNQSHMQKMVDGTSNSNMLLTGKHKLRVGTHRGHYRGMLREGEKRVIVRSRDNLEYTTLDDFESATPGDNIHPSFHSHDQAYSSAGCLTVRGLATRDDAKTNADRHSDPGDKTPGWATFRERLGLTRDRAPASEDGREFYLILLTGREARLVSSAGTAASLQRLRFGSEGPDVLALQTYLQAHGDYTDALDSQMGPGTTMAWIRYQQRRDGGHADGIVTPSDAPTMGFSLQSGQSVPRGMSFGGARQQALGRAPTRPRQPRLPHYGRVDAKKVSCANYPPDYPIFKELGTNDPVGEIEAACNLAVQWLDNTIEELNRIRDRVKAGEPPAWPVMGDLLAWSLKTRMRLEPDRAKVWTDSGPGTVEIVVRWLGNIRKILDGGEIAYTCLDGTCGTEWAFVQGGEYRIHLCRPFWHPPSTMNDQEVREERASTLIHEASHIYYETEDSGKGPGAAECLSQFVADANNIPIRNLQGRCGPVAPPAPGP